MSFSSVARARRCGKSSRRYLLRAMASPFPPLPASPAFVADDAQPSRCDCCDAPMMALDDDDGYALRGAGVYVWTRGEEVRREIVPLCATCAAGIGVSALAGWESEEEEG
jgi:hypothetical protein